MANNNKTKYVSATLDDLENEIICQLAKLQGIGRATALKLLLRETGPQKIKDILANRGDAESSVTGENREDGGSCQEKNTKNTKNTKNNETAEDAA